MPTPFANTTALVTGGAGFIGSNIAETLLRKGCRVRILDNFSTGHSENLESFAKDLQILEGDIRDPAMADKAVKDVDWIFHTAALPSVPRSMKEPLESCDINILGSLQILEAARRHATSCLVLSSSSSVYGESKELPKREEYVPDPLSPYAISKLAMEDLAQVFANHFGLKIVCLRYFNVYGPKQDPQSDYAAVIPLFIQAARESKPIKIFGDGKQTRDFTFIDDVVSANIAAAQTEAGLGEIFNIAGGKQISINDLAEKIGLFLKRKAEICHVPERPGDIRHSLASIEKAKKILKWQPKVSFEEGLRQTTQWFQTQF